MRDDRGEGTIPELATATGLHQREVHACLKALEQRGLVFERLGHKVYGEEQPRGTYAVTDLGLRYDVRRPPQ